jgi:sugar phosphate isomerase/epimerase
MMDHRTLKGENIAYSPEIWKAMFEAVPADNLGLELDPAHMVWQGIDYIKAIYDFGHKIFHTHAKDMEIRRDVLARCGIYGILFDKVDDFGHGWWRGRAPGWGEVNWHRFITALLDVGYTGNIDIEHEDPVFAKAANLGVEINEESDIINNYSTEESGLILGYNTLSVLIPK